MLRAHGNLRFRWYSIVSSYLWYTFSRNLLFVWFFSEPAKCLVLKKKTVTANTTTAQSTKKKRVCVKSP